MYLSTSVTYSLGFHMHLHCIRSFQFFEKLADLFFSIHISFTTVTSLDGFPIYFHCIRLLHFWKNISDFLD